jgi:hypothetical protein
MTALPKTVPILDGSRAPEVERQARIIRDLVIAFVERVALAEAMPIATSRSIRFSQNRIHRGFGPGL